MSPGPGALRHRRSTRRARWPRRTSAARRGPPSPRRPTWTPPGPPIRRDRPRRTGPARACRARVRRRWRQPGPARRRRRLSARPSRSGITPVESIVNAPSVVVKVEIPSAVFVSGLSPVPVGRASARLGWASASRSFTERLSGDACPAGAGPSPARATIPGRATPWMTPEDRGRCDPDAGVPPAGGTGSGWGAGAVPAPGAPRRAGAGEAGTARCRRSEGGTTGVEPGSRSCPRSGGGATGTERGSRSGSGPCSGGGATGPERGFHLSGAGEGGTGRCPRPGSAPRSGTRSDEDDEGGSERREQNADRAPAAAAPGRWGQRAARAWSMARRGQRAAGVRAVDQLAQRATPVRQPARATTATAGPQNAATGRGSASAAWAA